jgi:hypothetical protein
MLMSSSATPPRVPVSPTLAASLERAEASTRAEGVDPDDNPAYLDVKRRLLAGEITMEEAETIYEDAFTPSVKA